MPEEWNLLPVAFGDRVKVKRSHETESAGFADQIGIVQGITTVSVSGVNVIGFPTKDIAINVFLKS